MRLFTFNISETGDIRSGKYLNSVLYIRGLGDDKKDYMFL